jgi:hypothetical protein
MTSKEKAIELVNKFTDPVRWKLGQENVGERAKECALIAVNEIMQSRKDDRHFDDTLSSTSSQYFTPHPMYSTYWVQVKQEIEKL